MSVMKKIREKGLRNSFRMISVKLKKKTLFSRKNPGKLRKQELEKVFEKDYEKIIIFENHFGFYNIMLQRPQHLTKALSDDSTLVLYNSFYDVDFKNQNRLEKLNDNFYIIDLYFYRNSIFRLLETRKVKKYVMVYSTDTVKMNMIKIYQKHDFRVIYEYVDDINPDLISKKKVEEIVERHNMLIQDPASYVIATAGKLYDNVLEINKKANVQLISNGADCSTFLPEAQTSDEGYCSWLRDDKIKVGYYGALANWVDYDLLKRIAQNQEFQIILIGVKHDNSLEESGILEYDNVKYFGKISYDLLAGYANKFDICTIPFLINDITRATSPVKLFEYMSLQKPIVTTALPECMKYNVVKVARSKEEFVKLLFELYEKKDDEDYKKALKQCALDNSWKAKAEALVHFLESEEKIER